MMTLRLRSPLPAATLYVCDVQLRVLAAFDVNNCSLKLLVFALSLLQKIERRPDDFCGLLEHTRSDLGFDEFQLLWRQFNHC
jgi:hypothetical protein